MTENLTRTYQKIFAKNSGAQGKTVFGSTAQGNTQYTTDISAMQSEAYENGFAAAVVSKKAPVMQDFNTVENITTRQLAYLFQKGIPEWNSETTYFKGNIVLNIESDVPVLYYSLIDNNLNNQVSNTESWKKVILDININGKANTNLNNLNTIIISTATDLNTITTPGNYEFSSAVHTNTPFPAGVIAAFGMLVIVNNNVVLQYIWSYENTLYYRTCITPTANWSAWSQIVDTNLNYLTTTGKELIYTAGAPDYANKTDITINVEYTASSNGYIYLCGTEATQIQYYLTINGVEFLWDNNASVNANSFIIMPIAKNDTYKVSSSSGAINNYKGYFIPVKTI